MNLFVNKVPVSYWSLNRFHLSILHKIKDKTRNDPFYDQFTYSVTTDRSFTDDTLCLPSFVKTEIRLIILKNIHNLFDLFGMLGGSEKRLPASNVEIKRARYKDMKNTANLQV